MEPEQARALLDDLDVYVKKNKSSKLSKRQIKTRTEKKRIRKRNLASNQSKDKEKVNQRIQEKYAQLEDSLLAREDNLLEVQFMQDEIRRTKEDSGIELGNIESWSVEFIWLLMIQERLGFNEIRTIKDPSDLGFDMDEWLSLKAEAESDEFKQKIMRYKGIELSDPEVDEILTEEESDFEPAQDRETALKNFGDRNKESRQGYGEDTREAEELTFSDENQGYEDANQEYEDANQYYREPTGQEDGQNSENDYEY